MPRLPRPAALAVALLAALPAALAAQAAPADSAPAARAPAEGADPTGPHLALDLTGYSAMVWRGVTSANRPVAQPTLTLSVPTRAADLTVGAWSSAELAHYRPATQLDAFGGAPGPAFTMHELWVEAARSASLGPVRGATASLGASAYLYPRAGGLAADYNTVELHGKLALPAARWLGGAAPTLAANYDVGRVGGAYVEAGAAREVQAPGGRLVGGRTFAVAAAAGWSAGQGARGPEDAAYFARDGFTHAEASIATGFALAGASLTPSLHVAYAADPWARLVAPDRERRWKAWVGTSVAWDRAVGRRARLATQARPAAASAAQAAPAPAAP